MPSPAESIIDPAFRIQPDAFKDAGESLKVRINVYDMCAVKWEPNEPYTTGDFVRPVTANGFAYQVTTGGVSDSKEPRWPTVLGQTRVDGSVTWTCVAAGSSGLNAITSPTAQPDPAGLTINDVSVSEAFKILATYVGGTLGQSYDAVYNFTLDGVTRIARQRVFVRQR